MVAEAMKHRLPRSNPDDRRNHIIAVAIQVFARMGYGSCSMSSIAAHLGGSKATLYSYFSSKENLFEAAMEFHCEQVLAPMRYLLDQDVDDLETLLGRFGQKFLECIHSTGSLDIYRLIESEGARFPEIAETFFRLGPNFAIENLNQILKQFSASGMINCFDTALASDQFIGMLKGDRHLRYTTGLMPAPGNAEIERHARHAARIFVRGLKP
jgi:TetR/AcrR family transcriptional regulator, mexJK operon transcriptional repressor